MDIATLNKANHLNRTIKEFEEALNCFVWEDEYGGGSRNPRLVIEFDDNEGDRAQVSLPMNLSNTLVELLKAEIIEGRDILLVEFNAL